MWTRLHTAAAAQSLTLEQLAELPDNEIMRFPNLGAKSLRTLRALYPKRFPPIPERGALIERFDRALAELRSIRAALIGDID